MVIHKLIIAGMTAWKKEKAENLCCTGTARYSNVVENAHQRDEPNLNYCSENARALDFLKMAV